MMASPCVFVTGALSGIGRATAIAHARQGALAAELTAPGAEALLVQADARREDDVENLLAQASVRFGRLDVVVNEAGTEGHPGPLTEVTAEDYREVFETDVLGTLLGSKHAVEDLTRSAAIEAAARGVRVVAVAPGATATAMPDRLTGSQERLAAFANGLPCGAWARRRRWRRP